MEIRALTGFDETVREKYGRSYSPLSGTALGAVTSSVVPKIFDCMRGKPEFVYKRRADGSHSFVTEEGDIYYSNGTKYNASTNTHMSWSCKDYEFEDKTPVETFEEDVNTDINLPSPTKAGFNPKTLIGVGVAAAIMLSLYLSLNKK